MKPKNFPIQASLLHHNEKRWAKKIIKQEVNQLRREHLHLLRTSKERALSDWELDRVLEIKEEAMRLLVDLQVGDTPVVQ